MSRAEIVEEKLSKLFAPQLQWLIDQLEQGINPFFLPLPEDHAAHLSAEEQASLVAKAANFYGQAAFYAGIGRAEARFRRGAYERKFKRSRRGRNDAERSANAMDEAVEEHAAAVAAEALADVLEGMENAARVTSESIRKIYKSTENQVIAANRELRGAYREQDFTPY